MRLSAWALVVIGTVIVVPGNGLKPLGRHSLPKMAHGKTARPGSLHFVMLLCRKQRHIGIENSTHMAYT